MQNPRIAKPLIALSAALLFGSGAALAQNAGGGAGSGAGSGKSEPRIENTSPTMKGMDQDYTAPLQRSDTPQYQETHKNKGKTIGKDSNASGQVNENGPAYQGAHEDRGNPGGPVEEPVE
ncbi:MAG: hypothetical protein AB7S41_19260 [Parvibaculaceae bacterium]